MELAVAGRSLRRALAAGSIPPEMENLWTRLRQTPGVEVDTYRRGAHGEQGVPDVRLQLNMYKDVKRYPPGVAVLLTGDEAGYQREEGFLPALRDVSSDGWKIELLSWEHCVNRELRRWVEDNGVFISLDKYYDQVTYLEPGFDGSEGRLANRVNLTSRPTV